MKDTKKIQAIGLGTAALLMLSACSMRGWPNSVQGSGNVVSETRPVSGITSVALSGIGNLVIDQTGTESLTLEGDDNLLPLITTEVKDGQLIIGFKPNTIVMRSSKMTYILNVKALEGIDLSGAGTVNASNLSEDALSIESSGAGAITTQGKLGSLNVGLSGAGSFDGANLETRDAEVEISGIGSAVVNASDSLDVAISGAGSVEYIGSPQVTQHISGAGSVKQRAP